MEVCRERASTFGCMGEPIGDAGLVVGEPCSCEEEIGEAVQVAATGWLPGSVRLIAWRRCSAPRHVVRATWSWLAPGVPPGG